MTLSSCNTTEKKDEAKKPTVLVLLGAPGSGKGTQAKPLAEKYGLPHISTGDLFRAHLKNNTELGMKAKSYIQKGHLVPDELVFDILFERTDKADCKNGYILDGFPRTLGQAQKLKEKLFSKVHFIVFNFDIPDEVVIQRLAARLTCKACGAIFNKNFNPPKVETICDKCGGELYTRNDDKEEVILERLKVYYNETKPVEEFFKNEDMLINIDATLPQSELLKSIESHID